MDVAPKTATAQQSMVADYLGLYIATVEHGTELQALLT